LVRLILDNVGLDYPIYHSSARSIRKHLTLTTRVGGKISSGPSASITVVQALRDINLDLRSGDRLGLVGHNGAGKTTLLRVLAGIYHPTAGTIRCEGLRMPLTDIQVGGDDEATGYEMILMRGLLMGLKRSEIEAKVEPVGPCISILSKRSRVTIS
jgi:ABC-2 type transport system ATP-binding protein/lipopolysaccharide transport system ATP-binding protein